MTLCNAARGTTLCKTTGTVQPAQTTLAVGAISRIILILDVLDERYGRFRIKLPFG